MKVQKPEIFVFHIDLVYKLSHVRDTAEDQNEFPES